MMKQAQERAKPTTESAGAAAREGTRTAADAAMRWGAMQAKFGNRGLVRMLHGALRGGAAIQRGTEDTPTDETETKTDPKAVYEKKLRAAFDGPATFKELMTEAGEDTEAQAALLEANAAIELEVEALRGLDRILYGESPLSETDGMAILEKIEKGNENAFDKLKNKGAAFDEKDARSHEWGLGRARDKNGEVFLIYGDTDGVSWGPYLHALAPLAHSHPYFENGPTRRRNRINLETKEIADHPSSNHIKGIVRWTDLAAKSTADMSSEVAKIFPSASDVAFSAKQGVPKHVVYTPYCVLQHPAMGDVIANPEFNNGKMSGAPRLYFEILDAKAADDTGDNYACTMKAFGASELWSATVTTQGSGQFGTLRW